MRKLFDRESHKPFVPRESHKPFVPRTLKMSVPQCGLAAELMPEALLDLSLDAALLGRSLLLHAAMQGHLVLLRHLLQRLGSRARQAVGKEQQQLATALAAPFLGAAEQGHSHCLSALLESASSTPLGIDTLLMASDAAGSTALMLAAGNSCSDCVSLLLQHSPDAQLAAADSGGRTALMRATEVGFAGCVEQLLQHSPDAQVLAVDSNGSSALMTAACEGRTQCMRLLLQHSPQQQVSAVDNRGRSALMAAAREGHADCVRLLLQHSPDAQVAAADTTLLRETALMHAANYGRTHCAAILLQHCPGVQLAAATRRGETALTLAAHWGHAQFLELLLTLVSDEEQLDEALSCALSRWDPEQPSAAAYMQCMERLCAKGAQLLEPVGEEDRRKMRLVTEDMASRLLVADRANEAIVGLAAAVRSKKRKAAE